VSQANPWVAQRFIDGEMWSSMMIQKEGVLHLHTTTRATGSCFSWDHQEVPQIRAWNERFAAHVTTSGFFTNDFIVDKNDGVAYAIECNPRLGSQILPFWANGDQVSRRLRSILEDDDDDQAVLLPEKNSQTCTLLNEIFAFLDPTAYGEEGDDNKPVIERFVNLVKVVTTHKDPCFDTEDMLPFFVHNFCQMPLLLLQTLYNDRPWWKMDFQIGKVVERGGY